MDFSLEVGYNGSLKFGCCYLQQVPASEPSGTPNLKFWKKQHSTVLDPITGNFKASRFCGILDKFK
jgi:hypothetical protein